MRAEVSVWVKNRGTMTAPATFVRFTWEPAGMILGGADVPALEKGERFKACDDTQWPGGWPPESHDVCAIVDEFDLVEEIDDDDNNVICRTLESEAYYVIDLDVLLDASLRAPPDYSYVRARGINIAGQVVGYSGLVVSTANQAFIWENGVRSPLSPLPGSTSAAALEINDDGQVVGLTGSMIFFPEQQRAMLWQDAEPGQLREVEDLGTLALSQA